MTTDTRRKASPVEQGAVLTKAVLRAAVKLGVSNKVLAAVLGVSEATVSRMNNGGLQVSRGKKEFELGVLFVRLYRSLDAIVGGDDGVAAQWLRNDNSELGAKPIAMIQSITGLINVIEYLDARRA
jgi:hypothetical protein